MATCDPPQPQPPAGTHPAARCSASSSRRICPGLEKQPWPGPLGERIYDNVSAEAWKLWEERMKMILNEYRLMPWQKEAQQLVAKHMEDFFFGEGAALPPATCPSRRSRLIASGRPHADRAVSTTNDRRRWACRTALLGVGRRSPPARR